MGARDASFRARPASADTALLGQCPSRHAPPRPLPFRPQSLRQSAGPGPRPLPGSARAGNHWFRPWRGVESPRVFSKCHISGHPLPTLGGFFASNCPGEHARGSTPGARENSWQSRASSHPLRLWLRPSRRSAEAAPPINGCGSPGTPRAPPVKPSGSSVSSRPGRAFGSGLRPPFRDVSPGLWPLSTRCGSW